MSLVSKSLSDIDYAAQWEAEQSNNAEGMQSCSRMSKHTHTQASKYTMNYPTDMLLHTGLPRAFEEPGKIKRGPLMTSL